MCKIAIRNAGMKQDDIARVLNVSQSVVSRPFKKLRESGSNRKNSCLECMYPVNLMMKMCQVVIRQCEGYTQHKPEVVDYYEPFCDFLHQILKVYAPNRKF